MFPPFPAEGHVGAVLDCHVRDKGSASNDPQHLALPTFEPVLRREGDQLLQKSHRDPWDGNDSENPSQDKELTLSNDRERDNLDPSRGGKKGQKVAGLNSCLAEPE
jgi:hypothetical protein